SAAHAPLGRHTFELGHCVCDVQPPHTSSVVQIGVVPEQAVALSGVHSTHAPVGSSQTWKPHSGSDVHPPASGGGQLATSSECPSQYFEFFSLHADRSATDDTNISGNRV